MCDLTEDFLASYCSCIIRGAQVSIQLLLISLVRFSLPESRSMSFRSCMCETILQIYYSHRTKYYSNRHNLCTSSSLPKNGYFLSSSGIADGHSKMSFLLCAYVASISLEVTSFLGFFLFASSRNWEENRSNEHPSSPGGIGGGCIQAMDGDFWIVVFLLGTGVFGEVSQLLMSGLIALRSLLNSLNRFCRLVTIAPYVIHMYV